MAPWSTFYYGDTPRSRSRRQTDGVCRLLERETTRIQFSLRFDAQLRRLSICTNDALDLICQRFKAAISARRGRELLDLYQYLPRFDDVIPVLHSLRAAFRLFAFSNGKRSEIDAVLSNANIPVATESILNPAHQTKTNLA